MRTYRNRKLNTDRHAVIDATARITSKGQITVPIEIRNALNVKEGDQLRFVLKEGVVVVEPLRYLTADELYGIFNTAEDKEDYVLDREAARRKRAADILSKTDS